MESILPHRTLARHEAYIGIDMGARASTYYRNGQMPEDERGVLDTTMRQQWQQDIASASAKESSGKVSFLQANATRIPLRDQSVDEVIANNLFGGGAPNDELRLIYKEAGRVLKQDGTFVIHDDFSPRFVGPGTLRRWLTAGGLPVPTKILWLNAAATPDAYAEAAARFGFNTNRWAPVATDIDPETIKTLKERGTMWVIGRAAIDLLLTPST